MHVRKMLLAVAATVLLVSPADAQRRGFHVDSPRAMAMGGAGVAVPGGDNAVFMNPALLAWQPRTTVRILDVQARVNQNTFAQWGFYQDNRDNFSGLDEMDASERSDFYDELLSVARDQTTAGLDGAIPVSIIAPGWSIGLYERATATYDIYEGASAIPVLNGEALAEGAVVLGYGRNWGEFMGADVALGTNLKYVYRAETHAVRTAPALETLDDVEIYRAGSIALDFGIGVKLERWIVAMSWYDVNFPTFDWTIDNEGAGVADPPAKVVEASMRMGASYLIGPLMGGLFRDVRLAMDIESPKSDQMSSFKKLSLGAEGTFGFLRSRVGLHQGYPTFGASLPIGFAHFDYAFWGEATGRYAGQLENWNHTVAVGFGWGL